MHTLVAKLLCYVGGGVVESDCLRLDDDFGSKRASIRSGRRDDIDTEAARCGPWADNC